MKKSLLALAVLGGLCSCNKEKPNFLIIETDDQTFKSLNCLNNSDVRTPNIDRLVRMGTTFTHAYNQGSWSPAVSVASRTMLMTGQNMFNAPRNKEYLDRWAQTKFDGEATEVTLWGEAFKNAGYLTYMTGKWHNSDKALLKSFTEGKAIARGGYLTGVTPHYDRPKSNADWLPYDKAQKGHWTPMVKDIVMEGDNKTVTPEYLVEEHTSDLFGNTAIEFLRTRDKKQPFFAYIGFQAPHDPRQSPKEYVDMYPQNEIKIPTNFVPQHPFDQGDARVRDENLAPYPRTEESVKLNRQEYYAIITHLDKKIGDILDALEEEDLLDNTYIIFTSDHGLAVGHHGLMGKQNQYDHTTRVPMIIVGPGVKEDVRTSAQVYLQSVYPTTCELAGIPIPSSVDFTSFAPQIADLEKKGEAYVFGGYRNLQRALRSEKYKLILYPVAKQIQLFDMEKDPEEMVNLAHNVAYKDVVDTMFMQLQQKQKELGDKLVLDISMY